MGLEDDYILVCTSDAIWKAKDMRRDPRVALSDPISVKYTGAPFPSRGPVRVCFVIAVDKAACRALASSTTRDNPPVPRPVGSALGATGHGEQNLPAAKEAPMRFVTSGRPGTVHLGFTVAVGVGPNPPPRRHYEVMTWCPGELWPAAQVRLTASPVANWA